MDFSLDPQALIPKGKHSVYVPDKESLIFLGSKNLEHLKQYWMREEKDLSGNINALQSQIKLFGKSRAVAIGPKLAEVIAARNKTESFVKYISSAMRKAENKPYFSDYRPLNWFQLGDEVVCFVSDEYKNAFEKGVIVSGKVVNGHQFGYGHVSVCVDEPIYDGESCNVRDLSYNLTRPEIMHKWEWEYLKSHPDYFELWLMVSVGNLKLVRPVW